MAATQSVVVTGVSTGIGWGITKVLIAKNFRVFGSVRRQSDADRLQKEFGSAFTPLLMDVTDRQAVERAAVQVGAQLGSSTLAGLVNNAGVAVPGPLLHLPLDEYRRQLEVNLIAPLSVAQVFAPLLGAAPERQGAPGRIVNISSIAGKIGMPFLGAYVASKHALDGMSESLRREMMIYGIDVIVIAPGSVVTAIWDKAEAEDISIYANTEYGVILERFRKFALEDGRKGLTSERLGEAVHLALTAPQPKPYYAVVPQRFKNFTLPTLLPKRLVDKLIGKQFGLTRASAEKQAR
jgi:NAD(P)-dependent dehydrogenase (short-subunit alcohol dehydrogenase family)